MIIDDPSQAIDDICSFIKRVFKDCQKERVVIAVSGGIDSALCLTILARVFTPANIKVILMPYHQQAMTDAYHICQFNQLESSLLVHDIGEVVDRIAAGLNVSDDQLRLGNIKARVRMIHLYDYAKKHSALVCGTENRSEHLLGYYTRYGDEASDLELLRHLYKTQVRQLAKHLNLPDSIINKAPSADLWLDQSDEQELGFSYQHADIVLSLWEQHPNQVELVLDQATNIHQLSPVIVNRIIKRIQLFSFKHQVPYCLTD